MKYLANASKNWTQLTTLYLCKLSYYSANNNIGDDGMKYLVDASKNWTKLAYLSLCNLF